MSDAVDRTVETRADWEALTRRLLLRARDFGSPGHARIDFPGEPSAYGPAIGGLEGFARTFLLAACLVAGRGGEDPDGFMDWYAEGLTAGTAPGGPEEWVALEDHGQAKVEAASLVVGLHVTRPWLWDRLSEPVRSHVVAYLEGWIGSDYPPCNWVWFRILTEQFLLNVGSTRVSEIRTDLETDLAFVESLYRGSGWYSDGAGRAFDYYCGWAMQVLPTLWLEMAGDDPLAALWRDRFRERLDTYLDDYLHLVGSDGAPVFQGRSLIYRWATAGPFWAGAMAGVGNPGQLRSAASRTVSYFLEHGVLEIDDVLTLGWFAPWRAMVQHYSSPGSPYWAAKGHLGLLLPSDHPVWTAPDTPLPIDTGDTLRVLEHPGWIVHGTQADGIIRIANLGTDHADVGDHQPDNPLYAPLGFSTATAPLLGPDAEREPLDNAVVLYDTDGVGSHRTGFDGFTVTTRPLAGTDTHVGIGTWHGTVHWPDAPGATAQLSVVTVVRGTHEVRFARADTAHRIGFLGWPLAADAAPEASVHDGAAHVTAGRLRSSVRVLPGTDLVPAIHHYTDASPLGSAAAVPVVASDIPVQPGTWSGAIVELTGTADASDLPQVSLSNNTARISWPDGSMELNLGTE